MLESSAWSSVIRDCKVFGIRNTTNGLTVHVTNVSAKTRIFRNRADQPVSATLAQRP